MKLEQQIARRQPLGSLTAPSLGRLIHRIYVNRGINKAAELDYRLARLPRPGLLTGMNEACEILYDALVADASVLIVGDYDVDGATSTVLVKQVLEELGFNHVAYFVPDRMTFGYGLSVDVIEAVQPLQPDLLITVDNGISSHEGVKLAHEYGISVIVTDHHLPADTLPEADAIINPNLPGDRFPCKFLAGVGVAFYLLLGLRGFLRDQEWFTEQSLQEPALVMWLDLVALGTLADVVSLDFTNRLLVHQGMRRIQAGKSRPGIEALLGLSGTLPEHITCADIGFQVAPRINAAGRLDDMSVGIECLLAEDLPQAGEYAQKLDEINARRKAEQKKMNLEAADLVDQALAQDDGQPGAAICLYQPGWHPGIVGLIASRLKEIHHRPAVVFARDKDKLKGSARSIPGLHIRDLLATISARHPGMIEKYGGHAMAAGLTIDHESLEQFQELFGQQAAGMMEGIASDAQIISDGPLGSGEIEIGTASMIASSGPWGTGFEGPLFDNSFKVLECKTIGKEANHLRLVLAHPDSPARPVQAVAFFAGRYMNIEQLDMESIHAAYRIGINRYNGNESLQLVIENFVVN